MSLKSKIIFILIFLIVGASAVFFYLRIKKTPIPGTQTTTNAYPNFNSTTSTSTSPSTPETTGGNNETPVTPPTSSPFHKITEFSVAGATFFEDLRPIPTTEVALPGGVKPAKGKKVVAPKPKFEVVPSIRYVERVTGHITQMYLDTKVTGEVSNSTIPNIHEALFDAKASSIIYRYLAEDGKTITSFLATLGGTKGEFLPSDILDVSLSPDKNKFFYITKTFTGVVGTTRAFKDTKKIQVFNSSLTEWISQWVNDQTIYLTTKASASVQGNMFSLNIANGVLSKVLGGVPGLTTLANKDGSLVLYNTSTTTGPVLRIYNVKNSTTKDLNLNGLPEKCVWSNITLYCAIPSQIPGSNYPDSWYQGITSFDDQFVKIDTSVGTVTTLGDSTTETAVDGTHLFLNKDGTELFFINKKDFTLWGIDIK